MFHKRAPFRGRKVQDVKNKIRKFQIEFKKGFKNEWKEIILNMLQKDPKKRPQVKDIMNIPFIRNIRDKQYKSDKESTCDRRTTEERCVLDDISTKSSKVDMEQQIEKFAKKEGASFCGKYKYDLNGIIDIKSNSIQKSTNQDFSNDDDDDDFFNINKSQNTFYKKSKTMHVSNPLLFITPKPTKGN